MTSSVRAVALSADTVEQLADDLNQQAKQMGGELVQVSVQAMQSAIDDDGTTDLWFAALALVRVPVAHVTAQWTPIGYPSERELRERGL